MGKRGKYWEGISPPKRRRKAMMREASKMAQSSASLPMNRKKENLKMDSKKDFFSLLYLSIVYP